MNSIWWKENDLRLCLYLKGWKIDIQYNGSTWVSSKFFFFLIWISVGKLINNIKSSNYRLSRPVIHTVETYLDIDLAKHVISNIDSTIPYVVPSRNKTKYFEWCSRRARNLVSLVIYTQSPISKWANPWTRRTNCANTNWFQIISFLPLKCVSKMKLYTWSKRSERTEPCIATRPQQCNRLRIRRS